MKHKLAWTLFAVLAVFVSLAASAGHSEDVEKFDLAELADGETRIFGEGSTQVTATRVGDEIEIELADEDGDEPRKLTCKLGKGSCWVMTVGDSDDTRVLFLGDEGVPGHGSYTFSWSGDAKHLAEIHGHAEANVSIGEGGVFVKRLRAGDGDVLVRRLKEGPGEVRILELSGGSDVSFYECPEGDTTMRLEKDDQGPYFCPKHGSELVERKISGLHEQIRVLVETHAEE
jgi:hypothetical protein